METALEGPRRTKATEPSSSTSSYLSMAVSNSKASKLGSSTGNGVLSGTGGSGALIMSIGTKPTLIECKPMRFLIMDAPRQANLHVYIKEMRKHHVTDIVRVCEPTYKAEELKTAGICLHESEYKDGTSPPKELIMEWLQLVEKTFYSPGSDLSSCIAVHCVAGLGRAPVMVAIALIEFANMDPVEAVQFLRQKRRGAINEKQLLYLEGYKKQYRRNGSAESSCCAIL